MKKLFVSQPMNGKSDKEILDERNRLIAEAEERSGEKFDVLETFFRVPRRMQSHCIILANR